MARVLHLLDRSVHDEAIATLAQLVVHLGPPTYEHLVGLIGRPLPSSLQGAAADVIRFSHRLGSPLLTARPIRQAIRRCDVQLVHGWSAWVALIARIAGRNRCPVIVNIDAFPGRRGPGRGRCRCAHDEAESKAMLDCTTVFPSKRLRDRAVEAGLCDVCCGVIRPAADLRVFEEGRRQGLRKRLGIDENAPVLLTSPPPSRPGGHYYAVWAAAILQQIWPNIRVVVPGVSAEGRRLRRFAESFHLPEILVSTGDDLAFERLLSIANVMVMAATDDVPTGALGSAMSVGVPVVASAVPAVAEYLVDGHNGLLCEPRDPMKLAARIRTVLRDGDLVRGTCEAARVQGREFFDLARLVTEYRALYEDVLAGRKPFAHK